MAKKATKTLVPIGNTSMAAIKITPELAAEFKGRYPTGIRDQLLAIKKKPPKPRKILKIIERKDGIEVVERGEGLEKFIEEFLRNGGNATLAAMTVFNCEKKTTAAVIGNRYLNKAKQLGRIYMDNKGAAYGQLLDHAIQQMLNSKDPAWWDRLMKIGGYESPEYDSKKQGGQGPTINIVGAQNAARKKFGFGDVLEGEEVDE